MKNILRCTILVLLLLAISAVEIKAQDAKILVREGQRLAKEGWIVEPGAKSIDRQLKQVLLAMQDTTAIVAEGFDIAETYHEAYCKAYINALHDAARKQQVLISNQVINDKLIYTDSTNLNPRINNKFTCTESMYFQLWIKHEISDFDNWRVASIGKINGESRNVSSEGLIAESIWEVIAKIENIQIIQSLYRYTKDGKIEINLCIKAPK